MNSERLNKVILRGMVNKRSESKEINMKYHVCPPTLKQTTILFSLAIFLCGCSTSYLVSSNGRPDAEYSYRDMNEKLHGRDVKIELKDGREISAKEVRISEDFVTWIDRRTDEKSKASIRQLDKLVMKNHFLASLEGLGFGLIGGVGVFAVLLGINGRGGHESEVGILPAFMILGGAGGGIGLITGTIIGHRFYYEFPATEQRDSLQNRK